MCLFTNLQSLVSRGSGSRLALCEQGPKLAPKGVFPILAGGSRSRGAQTSRLPHKSRPSTTHPVDLLLSLVQVGSPTAQAIAATAQVQRRKWKMLMSRFRLRIACHCFRASNPFWERGFSVLGDGGDCRVSVSQPLLFNKIPLHLTKASFTPCVLDHPFENF
jgi:hypothetical protein